MDKIVAVDPGRDKCGVAVLDGQGEIILHEIIAAETLAEAVRELWQREQPNRLVIGDGTTSRQAIARLKKFYRSWSWRRWTSTALRTKQSFFTGLLIPPPG